MCGLNGHPQAWTPLCWSPALEAATHSLLILLGDSLKAEGFGDGFSLAKYILFICWKQIPRWNFLNNLLCSKRRKRLIVLYFLTVGLALLSRRSVSGRVFQTRHKGFSIRIQPFLFNCGSVE